MNLNDTFFLMIIGFILIFIIKLIKSDICNEKVIVFLDFSPIFLFLPG